MLSPITKAVAVAAIVLLVLLYLGSEQTPTVPVAPILSILPIAAPPTPATPSAGAVHILAETSYTHMGDSTADGSPVDVPKIPSEPVVAPVLSTPSVEASNAPSADSPAATVADVVAAAAAPIVQVVDNLSKFFVHPGYFMSDRSEARQPTYDAKSTAECAANCMADSKCIGFNRAEDAKICMNVVGNAGSMDPDRGTSYYRNIERDVVPAGDYLGDFITKVGKFYIAETPLMAAGSANECAYKCKQQAGCTGFNYSAAGICQITPEYAVDSPLYDSDDRTFYASKSAPAHDSVLPVGDTTDYLLDFTENVGKYHETQDATIMDTTLNECAYRCQRNPDCTGFNYAAEKQWCQPIFAAYPLNNLALRPGSSFYNNKQREIPANYAQQTVVATYSPVAVAEPSGPIDAPVAVAEPSVVSYSPVAI